MNDINKLISEGQLALADRKAYPKFDKSTYISLDHFHDFCDGKLDMVDLWSITQARRYKVDPVALKSKCVDVCPAFGTPLDYGLGWNMIFRKVKGRTNVEYYKPEVDHIKPKELFPDLVYDINNLQVVSKKCNVIKNNALHSSELDIVSKHMKIHEDY